MSDSYKDTSEENEIKSKKRSAETIDGELTDLPNKELKSNRQTITFGDKVFDLESRCNDTQLHRPKRKMRQNYNKNILLNFI